MIYNEGGFALGPRGFVGDGGPILEKAGKRFKSYSQGMQAEGLPIGILV